VIAVSPAALLRFKPLRYWYVKGRYLMRRRHMSVYETPSTGSGEHTIAHNLAAFQHDAVFGCGDRMGLLVYSTVSYYSFFESRKDAARVLMVGCRTEDDICWMKSYGFQHTVGFDLISYSDAVVLGDIHRTSFADNAFDVVLLGWMISYSRDPRAVVAECARILRPGGLLGIGIDHDPGQIDGAFKPPRVNALNTSTDLIALLSDAIEHRIVFEYDHYNPGDPSVAVLARISK
jgi:SAM-dependent methyltransferase